MKMIQGKARWNLTKCNHPGNTLTFGDMGLAPSETHLGTTGAVRPEGRKYIPTRMEIPDRRIGGKKVITVVHSATDRDQAKRLAALGE